MDSETPAPAPAPAIRAVADDMTAIFGATHRGDLPNDRAPALVPQRRHRAWRALVAVGGVATMITAGLIGGSAVLESGAAPAQRAAPKRVAIAHPAPAPTAAPVMIAAADPVPTPTPGDASQESAYRGDSDYRDDSDYRTDPDDRTDAAAAATQAPPRAVPSAPPVRQTAQVDTLPSLPPRPRRAAPVDRAPTVSYAARSCYDEASCLAPQLQAAERTVAVAYDRATAAQVRNGTLRDYRDEWVRARRVAQRRPREALRIYGMIAADLQLYADNAPGDDRMAWR